MQKIKALSENLTNYLLKILLGTFLVFVISALITQLYFVYLEFSGQESVIQEITNKLTVKFDGRWSDNPDNIWYEPEKHVWVEGVENKVKIGKLAGNRNLEFGVKNIIEEYLQDKEYDLSPDAPNKIKVEIVFLDVLTTKKNVSVFHKNEEEVVIRMKGILYKDEIGRAHV